MKIQVKETFIEGKVSQELCEDAYIVTDDFVAVIDGVTSKTPFQHDGKTTGRLASELIIEVIKNLDSDADFTAINQAINQKFDTFYQGIEFTEDPAIFGLQAAGIIYSKFHHTIWLVGDCMGLTEEGVMSNPKRSDVILEELRSLLWWFDHNRSDVTDYDPEQSDRGRETVSPWDKEARQFANDDSSPFGYSVFNGEMIPDSLVKTYSLSDTIKEISLCSDGYPKLFKTFDETEAYLKRVLEEDPNGVDINPRMRGILPGQKSYDDRTYVSFEIKQ
ncbi:hypothetical protein HZY88_01610 [Aerococcaceae bacterium DSM 111176]|nr:hypothetical protein [Aerococcaceae bacterium DSM 111176]